MPKKKDTGTDIQLPQGLSRREFFQITAALASGMFVLGPGFVLRQARAQEVPPSTEPSQELGTDQTRGQQGGTRMSREPLKITGADYLLKVDGIEGESTDAKHTGEIDLESFSWGESQTGTHMGGGGGAGKVNMQDFRFVMKVSKASPKLMVACASGELIRTAILTCRRTVKNQQQEFMKLTFTDALVAAYQTSAGKNEDEVPVDEVSLNFAKIEFEYGGTKAGWDLNKNRKV